MENNERPRPGWVRNDSTFPEICPAGGVGETMPRTSVLARFRGCFVGVDKNRGQYLLVFGRDVPPFEREFRWTSTEWALVRSRDAWVRALDAKLSAEFLTALAKEGAML